MVPVEHRVHPPDQRSRRSWHKVHDTVFDAEYLVLGLGDVYLGAPVATPLDPRHRLVTTKYNPARTWTPENAVGIGGAYLCIYGMEGPGGYQFVGRTTQVWNHCHPGNAQSVRARHTVAAAVSSTGSAGTRSSAEELMRPARRHGRRARARSTIDRRQVLARRLSRVPDRERRRIAAFRQQQAVAFAAERRAWDRAGEFRRAS